MVHTKQPKCRRTPSRRGRGFRRLAPGLVCAVGVLSPIAPAAGKAAAPSTPEAGRSTSAGLEFLDPLRGASGKLKAAFRTPGEPLIQQPPPGLVARYEPDRGTVAVVSPEFQAPQRPGVYRIAVEAEAARRDIEDLRVITLVPFAAKKEGQIGSYRLGQWPYERGGAPSAYAIPAGFVEVAPENRDLPVSQHFRLGDFLTKDQPAVWPKYVLLDAGLVDKLELVIAELEREGYPVEHLAIMSGFRTPLYNQAGGATSGRGSLSRHMYGDATDVFVDNDRDGWTDDVNRDGRIDIRDAEVVALAAERVEDRHPALVGGIGIYLATGAHGPFTHVDARGRRARWRGPGGG